MSGACAGLIRKVRKLQSLHRELAAGPLRLHQPFAGATDSISPISTRPRTCQRNFLLRDWPWIAKGYPPETHA